MIDIPIEFTELYKELDTVPISTTLRNKITELDTEIAFWDWILRTNMKPGEENRQVWVLLQTRIDAMRAYALVLQERLVFHSGTSHTTF